MADNGLWFEMGVRDRVTEQTRAMFRAVAELGEGFDTAQKNANDLTTAYYAIARAQKRLSDAARRSDTLGIDSSRIKEALRQLKEFEQKLRNIRLGEDGALDGKIISRKLNAEYKEMLRSITEIVTAQERMNASAVRSGNRAALREEIEARRQSAQAAREQAKAEKEAKQTAAKMAREAAASEREFAQSLHQTNQSLQEQSKMLNDAKSMLANYVSFYGMKNFLNQIIEVGGQFEVQHIALNNILGDMREGAMIYEQMKNLSVESPFSFMQLSSYARGLSAFGIPYEEMYDTTKRLADMSAGLGVDMNRIILAYGQIRSASVLKGTELRQLTEAGIPMVQALADEYTRLKGVVVTPSQVLTEMIPGKQVPFEMVKKILFDMTEEGGRFYNMQEKLADTLTGKMSNLKDAWQIFLSDLAKGESTTGAILKGAVTGLTNLIKLLQSIGPWIASFSIARVGKGLFGNFGKESFQTIQSAHDTAYNKALVTQIDKTKQLTAMQQSLIQGKGKMVAAEMRIAIQTESISRQQAMQLALQGKLTNGALRELAAKKLLTQEEVRILKNGTSYERMMLRWKLAGIQAWNGLKGIAATIKSFAVSNVYMLAFTAISGAIMKLIDGNNELKQAQEELRQSVKNTADEFQTAVDGLNVKPSDEVGLKSAVDSMVESLKKVHTSMEVKRVTDEADAIKTLSDRYDYLASRMRLANEARQDMVENTAFVANAKEAGEDVEDLASKFDKASAVFTKTAGDLERRRKSWNDLLKNYDLSKGLRESLNGKTILEQYDLLVDSGEIKDTSRLNMFVKLVDANREGLEKVRQELEEEAAKMGESIARDVLGSGDMLSKPVSERIEVMKQSFAEVTRGMGNLSNESRNVVEQSFTENMAFMDELFKALPDASVEGGKELTEELFRYLTEKIRDGWNLNEHRQDKDLQNFINNTIKRFTDKFTELKNHIENTRITALLTVGVQLRYTNPEDLVKLSGDASALWNMNGAKSRFVDKDGKVVTQQKRGEEVYEERFIGGQWRKKSDMNFIYGTDGQLVNSKIQKAQEIQDRATRIQNLKAGTTDESKALLAAEEAAQKKAIEDYQKEWNDDPTKLNSKGGVKGNKNTTDELLKSMRLRAQEMEKVKSLYKNFTDNGRSVSAALDSVRSSGMSYASLLPDHVTTKEEFDAWQKVEYQAIIDALDPAAADESRKAAIDEMLLKMNTFFTDRVKQQLEDLGNALQREIKEGTEKWNLYKNVLDKFGDAGLASQFGVSRKESDVIRESLMGRLPEIQQIAGNRGEYDWSTLLGMTQSEIEDAFGKTSKVWEMMEKYRNAKDSEEKQAITDVIAIMESTRNTYQKLMDELGKAELNKQKIDENPLLTDGQKSSMKAAIDADMADKIFKASPEYLQFFNAAMSMTTKQAEEVGQKIRENLDERMKAGTISAEDYYKEIERIAQQLDKVRGNRGGGWALFSGGLKGRADYDVQVAQDKVSNAAARQADAQQRAKDARERGDEAAANAYEIQAKIAQQEKENAEEELEHKKKFKEKLEQTSVVLDKISSAISGLSQAFDSIMQMAEALGADTGADTAWGDIKAGMDVLNGISNGTKTMVQGVMNGDAGSVISGAVGAITGPITTIAKQHDARLDAQIQKAEEQKQLLSQIKDSLENSLERTLGGIYNMSLTSYQQTQLAKLVKQNTLQTDNPYKEGTQWWKQREAYNARQNKGRDQNIANAAQTAIDENSYYLAEYALLLDQQKQVQKQLDAENKKKNGSSSKKNEYKETLDELELEIRDFATDMAKTLYDIDLKSWASELGDALYDAWKSGENAMDAYKDKLGDLIAQSAKNIITTRILESAMAKPNEELVKLMEANNGVLTEDMVAAWASSIAGLADTVVPNILSAYDALESELNKNGMTAKDSSSSSSGGTTIKGITEDQADVIISYMNGMRADLSAHVQDLKNLMNDTLPGMANTFEMQLAQLRLIEANTRRGADSTERIESLINSMTTGVKKLCVKI